MDVNVEFDGPSPIPDADRLSSRIVHAVPAFSLSDLAAKRAESRRGAQSASMRSSIKAKVHK